MISTRTQTLFFRFSDCLEVRIFRRRPDCERTGVFCQDRRLCSSRDVYGRVVGNPYPKRVTSELPVILPQWATPNRERQGALTRAARLLRETRFIENGLCGEGQGCRGRILERLYIDNCLPLTVELFRQLAFFILSCEPISYCRFKRIDVYIL